MSDRNVWGTPNMAGGKIITESNCRYCYFWGRTGWLIKEERPAYGCDMKVVEAPHIKDCRFYSREPGTDC